MYVIYFYPYVSIPHFNASKKLQYFCCFCTKIDLDFLHFEIIHYFSNLHDLFCLFSISMFQTHKVGVFFYIFLHFYKFYSFSSKACFFTDKCSKIKRVSNTDTLKKNHNITRIFLLAQLYSYAYSRNISARNRLLSPLQPLFRSIQAS